MYRIVCTIVERQAGLVLAPSLRTCSGGHKHHYININILDTDIVSFTNPLAAGSGLVERTPKKVLPPPIWSFSSPSFVVQRNTKLPKN